MSGNINLWDIDTGKKKGTIETHGKFAMAVEYVRPWGTVNVGGRAFTLPPHRARTGSELRAGRTMAW